MRKSDETPEEKWIRQLGSYRKHRREQAYQALAERGPAVTELLLEAHRRNERKRQAGIPLFFSYWLIGMGVMTGSLWLSRYGPFGVAVTMNIALWIFLWQLGPTTNAKMEIRALLTAIDDPRVCGPLAESLKPLETANTPALEPYHSRRLAVEAALIRLLPQLTEQNIPDWTASQRAGLRAVLKRAAKASEILPGNSPLICAALEAVAMLGDLQAQHVVAQLAKRVPRTKAETSVVEAAQRCEAALQIWQERNRNGEMLLRGSSQPAAAPETLLRVAPTVAREEPQQLLRATTTDETLS